MDGMVRHCLTNYEDGFQIYKWQVLKICCFFKFRSNPKSEPKCGLKRGPKCGLRLIPKMRPRKPGYVLR